MRRTLNEPKQAFYECVELIRCDDVHKRVYCEKFEKAHKKLKKFSSALT